MNVLGLRLPALAMGAACFSVPLIYWQGVFEFALLPRLLLLQFMLLVALVAWCSWVYNSRAIPVSSPFNLPVLLYFFFSLLSISWAGNLVEGTVQGSRLLTAFAIYFIAANAISRMETKGIYRISAIAGVLVSCVGICQFFGWGFVSIPTVGNPSATFGYRNFAASYLVVSIPVAIGFGVASTRLRNQALWWVAASLMCLFLAYTRTRGAWVGLFGSLLVTGIVVFAMNRWRGKTLSGRVRSPALLIALVVGLFFLATLQPRMEKGGQFGFDERKADAFTTLSKTFSPGDARGRLFVWKHTLEMILDHPFGVGLGGWQYEYPRYDKGEWISSNAAPQRPHNDFLWILSETGFPGFICYMWILYVLYRSVWRSLTTRPGSLDTIYMLGISAGLLALLGHSFFSFPKERVAASLLFWLGLGSVSGLTVEGSGRTRSKPSGTLGIYCVLPLLLLGALTVTYRQVRFDAHYLQALMAWRNTNWSQIIQQSELAHIWGNLNHRLLLLEGLAHHNSSDLAAAEQSYRKAQLYHPLGGHSALGAVYADMGRYEQSAQHYGVEHNLYPRSSDAAMGLARAYQNTNREDEALKLLRGAAEISPTSAEVHARLGRALQAQGDMEASLASYQEAVRLAPEEPRYHNNQGAALARLSRYPEAESAYKRAVSANPNYARPHHNLGDLYVTLGDTSNAIQSYKTFITLWKGTPDYIDLTGRKIDALEGKLIE